MTVGTTHWAFTPLKVAIPEHVPPVQRCLLQSMSKLLEDQILYWPGPTYPEPLPPTKFRPYAAGGPSLLDLFQADDNEMHELQALSLNSLGTGPRHLERAQWEQIAQDGTFRIASKLHPGYSHTWKVAQWLQKGRDPTHRSFERGLGQALYHLVVGVPDRLVRNNVLSVRRGLACMRSGLHGTVSLAVGLKEMVPKHTTLEVERLIREQENDAVKRWLDEEGSSFDTRIFDNEFLAEHKKQIDRHIRDTVRGGLHDSIAYDEHYIHAMKEVEALGVTDPSERARCVERKMGRRHVERLRQRLESDVSLPPGYGALWADRELLNCIIAEVEGDRLLALDEQRANIQAKLIVEHPILSTIPDWIDDKVDKELKKSNSDHDKWNSYREVAIIATSEECLGALAAVYVEKILPFRMNEEPGLRQHLSSEVKPARTFEILRVIWQPKNWLKLERQGRFEAQKYIVERVATDAWFWRISLILQQSRARFCNALFYLFRSLWNGSLGLKSLFLRDPFLFRFTMDPWSGDIIPDTSHRTHTLRSRLRAIRNHVRKLRDDFEAMPDTGFLGKSISRVLNVLSAYLGVGIPGTILVGFGQPLLTLVYGIVTMSLVVTAPLWSPLSSLVERVFSMTIYDIHDPSGNSSSMTGCWFPFVGCVLEFLLSGVLRAFLAALGGIVAHPSLAVMRITWEVIRRQSRMGYDWVMRHLLLRLGRVPAQDSFLAWRVAGPGITAKYCYQIRPEVAILVLEAILEEKELNLFEKSTSDKINEPLDKYRAFFKDFEVFGLEISGSHGCVSELKQVVEKQLKDLQTRLSQRRRIIRALTSFDLRGHGPSRWVQRMPRGEADVRDVQPGERLGWIKQNEQDLKWTSRLGEEVAASFCQRLEATYPEHIVSLWCETGLLPGNYSGLARHLLAQTFGDGIWTPLQETDETIVIPVKPQTLEKLVRELMQPCTDIIAYTTR